MGQLGSRDEVVHGRSSGSTMREVKVTVPLETVTWAAVVVAAVSLVIRRGRIRRRPGPQLRDHVHHVGHDHLTGAHGLEPLRQRAVWVLLDVHLRFYGYGTPAARRVDRHFLKLRVLNCIENPPHVLVHFEAL